MSSTDQRIREAQRRADSNPNDGNKRGLLNERLRRAPNICPKCNRLLSELAPQSSGHCCCRPCYWKEWTKDWKKIGRLFRRLKSVRCKDCPMPTTNQLINRGRRKKREKKLDRALQGNPQKKGTVLKVWVVKPRKPNSGDRKMVRVRLFNKQKTEVTATVPGQGMGGIQPHSIVLIKKGRVPDVPGVNYKVVRGAEGVMDENSDPNQNLMVRRNGRSKYGAKRQKGQ